MRAVRVNEFQAELSVAAILASFVWGHNVRRICECLQRSNELTCQRWVFNQWRICRHYWRIAPRHHWSRTPVLLVASSACTSTVLMVLVLWY